MKKFFIFWGESYLFSPSPFQNIISIILLPLSWLYCALMYLRFKLKKEIDFGVDIVSIGNLSVGGSGKTPLTTALASRYKNVAIILRGYGRDSQGMHLISDSKNILQDVSRVEEIVYIVYFRI